MDLVELGVVPPAWNVDELHFQTEELRASSVIRAAKGQLYVDDGETSYALNMTILSEDIAAD